MADRFEVKAICEEVSHLAESAAREFDAVSVDGYRALVGRDDVDAVLMLAPQWFGPLPILAACDYGKAVYCANAMDIQSAQAQDVRLRIEQAGIAFMLECPRRHAPATQRLKELVATHLGPPRMLFCHHRVASQTRLAPTKRLDPEDHMLQNLVEMVDWCRYVIGEEPTSVTGSAHASSTGDGDKEYEMMSLDFSAAGQLGKGPTAQISCGQYIPGHWPEAITFQPPTPLQVYCERGIAFVDLPASLVWFDEAGRHRESLESERPVGEQLLSNFYHDVVSLVRKTSSLKDSYQALEIVLAARSSWQQGSRVDLQA
jgi:predicted dehydrogenase